MLKICRQSKTFTPLKNPTLVEADILERTDLQEYIFNSPDAFFDQLGEKLFVVGKEITPSETVDDRIDLLAVDADGRAVIVELERGNNKFQHLQAIAYAGMISKWTSDDFIVSAGARADELRGFVDETTINSSQRIILVAEAYDYEVLAGAEWLYEQYGVEISCARVKLAVDTSTSAEYMSCAQVFPLPELAEQALQRGRKNVASGPVTSWDEYLSELSNTAVAAFIREELGKNCEQNTKLKHIFYHIGDKRRYQVEVRIPHATVRQFGRFQDDIAWWQARLSDQSVEQKGSRGLQLRFFLRTSADCQAFLKALPELKAASWDVDNLAESATA